MKPARQTDREPTWSSSRVGLAEDEHGAVGEDGLAPALLQVLQRLLVHRCRLTVDTVHWRDTPMQKPGQPGGRRSG